MCWTVYTDGSVLLTHGGVEMGQGLHTKMAQVRMTIQISFFLTFFHAFNLTLVLCQIAANALGTDISTVTIANTATDKVPNTSPTAASMSSDINGMAVLDACNQLNERLKPLREANPQKSFAEIAKMAYFERTFWFWFFCFCFWVFLFVCFVFVLVFFWFFVFLFVCFVFLFVCFVFFLFFFFVFFVCFVFTLVVGWWIAYDRLTIFHLFCPQVSVCQRR